MSQKQQIGFDVSHLNKKNSVPEFTADTVVLWNFLRSVIDTLTPTQQHQARINMDARMKRIAAWKPRVAKGEVIKQQSLEIGKLLLEHFKPNNPRQTK